MEEELNRLQNHFQKQLEKILPNTDPGREIIYKMAAAFNLPINHRTLVTSIQKLRPFPEIPPKKLKKQVPYEEFWVTDFELAHLNKFSQDFMNLDPKLQRAYRWRKKDIKLDGSGFDFEITSQTPVVMQSGRRTGVCNHLRERKFPLEVTAYMYQGNFTATKNLYQKLYSKKDLQHIEADEAYLALKDDPSIDSFQLNLKSKAQHFAQRRGRAGKGLKPMPVPDLDRYKFIQLQDDANFDIIQDQKRQEKNQSQEPREQPVIKAELIKEDQSFEGKSRHSLNRSNDIEQLQQLTADNGTRTTNPFKPAADLAAGFQHLDIQNNIGGANQTPINQSHSDMTNNIMSSAAPKQLLREMSVRLRQSNPSTGDKSVIIKGDRRDVVTEQSFSSTFLQQVQPINFEQVYQRLFVIHRKEVLTPAYMVKFVFYPEDFQPIEQIPEFFPSRLVQEFKRVKCASCGRTSHAYQEDDFGALLRGELNHNESLGHTLSTLGRETHQQAGLKLSEEMVYCHTEQIWLCKQKCNAAWHPQVIPNYAIGGNLSDDSEEEKADELDIDMSKVVYENAHHKSIVAEATMVDRSVYSSASHPTKKPPPSSMQPAPPKKVQNHFIINYEEIRYLAQCGKEGKQKMLSQNTIELDPLQKPQGTTCHTHEHSPLTIYCEDCDRFLCTKCLITFREEHRDHKIEEVKDLHAKAEEELKENVEMNKAKHEETKFKIDQVMSQMKQLKENTDLIEERVYSYVRMLLDQLQAVFTTKAEQLKANYVELVEKDQQLHFHQQFIQKQLKTLGKIDFLNSWEIYQKIYFQVTTAKLQVEEVDVGNIMSEIDFSGPALDAFEDPLLAAEVAEGVKKMEDFDKVWDKIAEVEDEQLPSQGDTTPTKTGKRVQIESSEPSKMSPMLKRTATLGTTKTRLTLGTKKQAMNKLEIFQSKENTEDKAVLLYDQLQEQMAENPDLQFSVYGHFFKNFKKFYIERNEDLRLHFNMANDSLLSKASMDLRDVISLKTDLLRSAFQESKILKRDTDRVMMYFNLPEFIISQGIWPTKVFPPKGQEEGQGSKETGAGAAPSSIDKKERFPDLAEVLDHFELQRQASIPNLILFELQRSVDLGGGRYIVGCFSNKSWTKALVKNRKSVPRKKKPTRKRGMLIKEEDLDQFDPIEEIIGDNLESIHRHLNEVYDDTLSDVTDNIDYYLSNDATEDDKVRLKSLWVQMKPVLINLTQNMRFEVPEHQTKTATHLSCFHEEKTEPVGGSFISTRERRYCLHFGDADLVISHDFKTIASDFKASYSGDPEMQTIFTEQKKGISPTKTRETFGSQPQRSKAMEQDAQISNLFVKQRVANLQKDLTQSEILSGAEGDILKKVASSKQNLDDTDFLIKALSFYKDGVTPEEEDEFQRFGPSSQFANFVLNGHSENKDKASCLLQLNSRRNVFSSNRKVKAMGVVRRVEIWSFEGEP